LIMSSKLCMVDRGNVQDDGAAGVYVRALLCILELIR
jgi:hypothetical protein